MKNSNESKTQGRLPKLRFPEFRGAWEYKEIGPYLEGYSGRVSSTNTDLPVYSSTRDGLKFQKDYYDGRELVNDGEYGVVPKGYFVYRHMSDDIIFKFNINDTDGPIAVSKEYPVFRTVNLNSYFLLQKMNAGFDFQRFAEAQKKGGTRTRLYFKTLCSWKTLLPSLPEQHKIADCLASLDTLITAHTHKLDALKAHKHGLMQQLFPAEGDTAPRLRFPEFRDAGEWEEKRLGDISFKISSGKDSNNFDGNYDLYGSTGIIGKTSNGSYDGEFILVARVGANAGLLTKAVGKFGVTDNTLVIYLHNAVNLDFIFYVLEIFRLNRLIFGSGQPLITGGQLKAVILYLPRTQEQQKIADCLSALDDLIALQTHTVATLKTHKHGLLQQLFPAADEAAE